VAANRDRIFAGSFSGKSRDLAETCAKIDIRGVLTWRAAVRSVEFLESKSPRRMFARASAIFRCCHYAGDLTDKSNLTKA
jgi:hypothetical protein